MTTTIRHAPIEPPSKPTVTFTERVGLVVVVVLAAALGLLGMVNSFARVDRAVAPSFGELSWTVPLGIDVGIAVFTGLDLVLTRMGMRAWWLRGVPWLLVAVTVYLNVADEHTAIGVVAHAVLPALWVIAVEAGSHALRVHARIGGRQPKRSMDRVRWSRWLLAPVATVRLWRRMVLWEVTDYSVALRREQNRVLARSELADRYGRLTWRWKAPRRQRVLYRLGELAPEGLLAEPPSGEPTAASQGDHVQPSADPSQDRARPSDQSRRSARASNDRSEARTRNGRARAIARPGDASPSRAPVASGRVGTRTIDHADIDQLKALGMLKSRAKVDELLETAAWVAQRQAENQPVGATYLGDHLKMHPSSGSRRLTFLSQCEEKLCALDAQKRERSSAFPALHVQDISDTRSQRTQASVAVSA